MDIPRPVLLGSNNAYEIHVEGMAIRSALASIIRSLDEPFNPHCRLIRIHTLKKRMEDLSAEINGSINSTLRSGFQRVCFLEATGDCDHGIVRAHAIQKALLKEYAIDGHVLHFDAFDNPDDREVKPKKIGVNEATTFTGFCSKHDNQVFKVIEQEVSSQTPEALFLYAYRSLCVALYTSKYKYEAIKAPLSAVEARNPDEKQNKIKETIFLNTLTDIEISDIKKSWDKYIGSTETPPLDHLVLLCPKSPDIVASLFFAPRKDFRSRIIQDTKGLGKLQWVAFSLVPRKEGGGMIIISANKGDRVWKDFTDSLLSYPPEKRTMALMNYVICHFGEHIILSPKWWHELSEEKKDTIIKSWNSGYYPRHLKSLCDWGTMTQISPRYDPET